MSFVNKILTIFDTLEFAHLFRRGIMIRLFIIFLISSISKLYAQGACLAIQGAGNSTAGRFFNQTSDGGYVVTGTDGDFLIIKLNSNGDIVWTRRIGGSAVEWNHSTIITSDGGYVMVGYTESFGTARDIYVVKLDANGNIQWTKVIGGSDVEEAYSVVQTSDGGYIVVGYTQSFGFGYQDMYIIKLSANGNLEWSKVVGSYSNDYAYSITRTKDGNYAIAGYTLTFGSFDIYVLKIDLNGNIKWSRTIGGSGSDYARSVASTNDGGLVVTGYTFSFGSGSSDVYVIKLDSIGNVEWSKVIGSSGGDVGNFIIQTADSGYAIAGATTSFSDNQDVYIVKLDKNGNLQWTKVLGGVSSDWGYFITQLSDGSYAIAGTTSSFGSQLLNIYALKINANGEICSNCNLGSIGQISSPGSSVFPYTLDVSNVISNVSSNGSVASGGTITIVCGSLNIIENNFDKSLSTCYSNGRFKINLGRVYDNISVSIKDVLGRELTRRELKNVDRAELDIKGKNGIYFVELRNRDKKAVFKVVKAR